MKETDEVLLQLISRALFRSHTNFNPSSVNWEVLYAECVDQAVTILIWDTLTNEERSCLPEDLALRWEQSAMLHMMNNEQLSYEQGQIIQILSDAGIPCVILKGSSSALCYPNPSLRSMGDIDLLVKPEQQLQAVRLLQEHGYGDTSDENHHCHMAIHKGKISVEIHREPNGLFLNQNSESLKKLRAYFDDAIERRQYVDHLPVLADDQQAISLILHKMEHFLTSGLGLRQLCDWAVFVEQRLDETLWESLKPFLSECGILYFTGIITRACVDYLGLPEQSAPWAMDYDNETAKNVTEQILKEGNFGRKADKYGERLFSNPNSSNRFSSFFSVLFSACKEHWPVCERHPICMPIAPFVLLGRYLLQRRRGERPKLNLIKKYRQGGDDQQLFRSLKPFVSENHPQ